MYAELLADRATATLASAQNANGAGANVGELRDLLVTTQDTSTLLMMWLRGKGSDDAAAKHAEQQVDIALRIKELVAKQSGMSNTCE